MVVFTAGTLGLTAALTYMTMTTARLLRRGPLPYNPLLHPLESLFRLGLLVLCGALIWLSSMPLERFGVVSFDVVRDLGLASVLGVIVVWAINGMSALVLSDSSAGLYSKNALASMRPRTLSEMLLTVPATFPAAALEELLFRSMWIGGFSVFAWASPPLLIAIAAVLFGIMHVAQGVWGVVVTGLIGALFGLLFVLSGSLWFVLVIHWVMNVNQFVVAWRQPHFFDLDDVDDAPMSVVDSG